MQPHAEHVLDSVADLAGECDEIRGGRRPSVGQRQGVFRRQARGCFVSGETLHEPGTFDEPSRGQFRSADRVVPGNAVVHADALRDRREDSG